MINRGFVRFINTILILVIFAMLLPFYFAPKHGFHWTLPEVPTRNEFFYDIGVKIC